MDSRPQNPSRNQNVLLNLNLSSSRKANWLGFNYSDFFLAILEEFVIFTSFIQSLLSMDLNLMNSISNCTPRHKLMRCDAIQCWRKLSDPHWRGGTAISVRAKSEKSMDPYSPPPQLDITNELTRTNLTSRTSSPSPPVYEFLVPFLIVS